MAEAESVLQERPKIASSISMSIDDDFHESSTLERLNKVQGSSPPSSPSTLQESALTSNGCILSPILPSSVTAPERPSTLRKSDKQKLTKSSKDKNSKHSNRTFCYSPDQSDNGECPYADLDSVPKILCPKALERQPKLVPAPPSVAVVKEVKKQPEIQSGLWFSKSSKERRPKTISPMPDRTLFSKVPSKKKNSSVVSKKMVVPGCSSSSGGITDQSDLSDKNEMLAPAETNLPSGQSGHLKYKNNPTANRVLATTSSPTEQSVLPERSLNPVETVAPSHKGGYSKGKQTISNSTNTLTCTASDQLGSSDIKKASEPNTEASFNDRSRLSKSVKSINRSGRSDTKNMCTSNNDSVHAAEKETPMASLHVNTTELEKHARLIARCRMPFVKLIRKDLQLKKVESNVANSPIDPPECTKNENPPDKILTKISSKQSDCVDNCNASVTIDRTDNSAPIKASVKKLKASDESAILYLSSEPVKVILSSGVSELSSTEAKKVPIKLNPANMTDSSHLEDKKKSSSKKSAVCSERSDSIKQKCVTNTAPVPSLQLGNLVGIDTRVPEGLSCEKSKKVVHKSKQDSDKVSKKVLPEQPAHLPASSRLMTRALKAMKEAKREKREKARKEAEQREPDDLVFCSSHNSTWHPEAKLDSCVKMKFLKSHCNDKFDQDTFSSCSTPPFSSSDFEADIKSEDEDLSVSSTPPMDFIPLTSRVKSKKEDHFSDIRSSSLPSSPFSFMNTFKNLEEVSFQSLTNESGGKPISFKVNTNYTFSTFLMMLKDLHDTREREGTPLELEIGPPSAHVKEEPLVLPGEVTPARKYHQTSRIIGNTNSIVETLNRTQNEDRTRLTSKRPYNRRGSSNGVKKKTNRKVPCHPAKPGPGFRGLDSIPAVDSSSGAQGQVQSHLDIQLSKWERLAGGSEGVPRDEKERWSRINENLENVVPLEQRVCNTTLSLAQTAGLIADCTETNAQLTQNVGEGDKGLTGKDCLEPSSR